VRARLTPTPDVGKELLSWLESSGIPTKSEQIPEASLHEIFGQLGLDDLREEYQGYVCERYGVNAVNEMNADQVSEQVTLLKQCQAKSEKLAQFANILRDRKLAA